MPNKFNMSETSVFFYLLVKMHCLFTHACFACLNLFGDKGSAFFGVRRCRAPFFILDALDAAKQSSDKSPAIWRGFALCEKYFQSGRQTEKKVV